MNTCPNQHPATDPGARRLCLVGENPAETELRYGVPFCGAAGSLLNRQLEAVGLPRSRVFVGNLCQHFSKHWCWQWTGSEVQSGIAALLADLAAFKPNLVVPLGNAALHLFMNGNTPPATRLAKGRIEPVWEHHVTDWRGSLFESSPFCTPQLWTPIDPPPEPAPPRWKCMATVHPAFVLRSYGEIFNLRQDLRRALSECASPALKLPELDFAYGPAITDDDVPF